MKSYRRMLQTALPILCVATCLLADRPLWAAPEADGWKLAFQDDFERSAIGTDWVVMRGDWYVKDGKLCITREPGWSSDSAVRTVATYPENERLEFDVSVPGPYAVKAAVRIGDQYWDGGGPARAGRGAQGNHSGEVALAPAANADKEADFKGLQPNRTYHVVVQYEDGRFQAWVDGKLVRDEKENLAGGFNDHAALYGVHAAAFDNVKLYVKPYGKNFAGEPKATPETNRRATLDAAKFIDPAKPACGIQAAIDSLPPTGGAVILPKGEFVLHQSLFLPEGVCLRGQGPETKLMLPSPIVWTTLSAVAAKGATTIAVADASRLKPGWMLSFGGAMYYLANEEPWRVKSIHGNQIELNRPLDGPLGEKTAVGNWFPVIYAANTSRIEVRDLDIYGRADDPAPFDGGYGASAVTMNFVREVRVCGVNVHGWKGDAFSFQGGRDTLCTGNSIVGATGKGYHPGSCQQRIIISRNRADGCGDDGLFYCRYNQLSVMSNNTLDNNRGAMIGGLAAVGDMFNNSNHNLGRNNHEGIPFAGGANDVLVGNVIVDTATAPVIGLSGGVYTAGGKAIHPYQGPNRYHVIASNVFVSQKPMETVVARPGAEANMIALNQTASGTQWQKPPVPASPPPLPPTVVEAAKFYDPNEPDCGFQKAIDAAAAKGGTVRLPAGVYPLAKPLTVPSGVTLCGEGLATRLIGQGRDPVIVSQGTQNVAVRRLRVEGGSIRLERVINALVEGVNVESAPGAGILVADSRDVLISQCRARACATGYDLARVDKLDLVESWALENRSDGLKLADGTQAIHVDSCVFWCNRRNGIRIESVLPGQLTVMSCVVSSSGEDGVLLQDCGGAVFRGNVVHNSSLQARGRFAGVTLRGNTHQARVTENRIGDELYDPQQLTAVRETDGAGDNVVQYNVLCPDNWPREGKLDRVIVAGKGQSVIEPNVLYPYPPAGN